MKKGMHAVVVALTAGAGLLTGNALAGVSKAEIKDGAARAGAILGMEDEAVLGFELPTGERFLVAMAEVGPDGAADALMLLTWFPNNGGRTAAQFNLWNQEMLAQGFLDGDNDGQLNLPVFARGNADAATVAQAIEQFSGQIRQFRGFMTPAGQTTLGANSLEVGISRRDAMTRDDALTQALNARAAHANIAAPTAMEVGLEPEKAGLGISPAMKDWVK